jgi:hypothetical protein
MQPTGMWRRVGLVKFDVSEEQTVSQLLMLFFASGFSYLVDGGNTFL